MGTPRGFPPKHSSSPIITSVEKKCTCCLLHPIGSESSWFSSSQSSRLEPPCIPLLVTDLVRLGVVDPPKISFKVCSSPKNTDSKKKWNEWVEAMAHNKKFFQTLQQAGIYDAIVVASVADDVKVDQQMMEALFGYWCSATNTFIFPWGEAGFTPEDSHIFTALPLRGSDLDRKLTTKEENLKNRLIVEVEKISVLNREAQREGMVTQEIWLDWFTIEEDIDDELKHLGFLTYWLCKDVFPSAKQTLAAIFGLAARLSLGDRIALAPALVANIYHDLNVITESIARNQWKKDKSRGVQLKASTRFDILQCWVWERFQNLRPNIDRPILQQLRVRMVCWSGMTGKTGYDKAMEIFQDERCFTWRPYSYRRCNWVEPEWYDMESHVITIEAEDTPAYVYDFLALVSCTSVKGLSSDGHVIHESYQPNRFARQFGFDQAVPRESDVSRTFIYHDCSTAGVQVCIPGITRYGNPTRDYIKWWKTHTKNYRETLRERFMPKAEIENNDNGVRKNWDEKYKSAPGDNNKNTSQKRKAEEISKHQSVTVLSYPANKKLACSSRLHSVEDTGSTAVPSVGTSWDKATDIINIDSDDDDNLITSKVPSPGFAQEDKVNFPDKNEFALVKELEEFQRHGLMTYQELSAEIVDSGNMLSVKCKKDPYGQEVIERYPNFFRLIPQCPHYKGLLNGRNITEGMKQHIFLGLWCMLVNLMREVLRTNVKTNAMEIERMFSKARMLDKNGFDVKHLIARLKLVQKKTIETRRH